MVCNYLFTKFLDCLKHSFMIKLMTSVPSFLCAGGVWQQPKTGKKMLDLNELPPDLNELPHDMDEQQPSNTARKLDIKWALCLLHADKSWA